MRTTQQAVEQGDQRGAPGGGTALPLVSELLRALEREAISYCHWKSNDALERSASGENDLDLLVARSDAARFVEILHGLGMKQATPSPDKRLPGVLDFYGYDSGNDRFVHVHVHFQLIVGHDATKNYSLPLERVYLESPREDHGFRIPPPEADLVVLVIRLILKHATWDAMLVLHGRVSASERDELRYLLERVDMDAVRRLLESHLPCIRPELFEHCLRVAEGRRSVIGRIRTGQSLRRALAPFARRGQLADGAIKIARRAALAVRRKVFGLGRRKARLSNGGLMIAFVGGDGSGKSTAVEGVSDWLSRELDVRRMHLGKPPRSISTRLVQVTRTASRLALDTLGRKKGKSESGGEMGLVPTADGSMKRKARLSRMLWEFSVARDRYRAYAKARRFSMNGGLIVCDRFPLPGVIQLMDAPQLEAAISSDGGPWLIRRLASWEKRWYQAMVPPELLVVLRLDPDTAVRRKKDEGSAYVRMRSQEVWQADFSETPAVLVDASKPRHELLSELKELVWARI